MLCHYKSLFDGKPVYQPFWNENIHVSKTPLPVERNRELYLAFDFGLTPACVAGQLMPNGQLRILREWCSENMGLRQFCRDLLLPDLSRDFNGMRYVVTGDPAGAQRSQVDRDDSCYAELARNGLSCTAARTNDFEPRRRAVRRFFSLGFSKCLLLRSSLRVPSLSSFFLRRRSALSIGSPFFMRISVASIVFTPFRDKVSELFFHSFAKPASSTSRSRSLLSA